MRTNIDIDDNLMRDAIAATGEPTKRAVVERALRLLIRPTRQGSHGRLRGKVAWQGDLAESRRTARRWPLTPWSSSTVRSWIAYLNEVDTAEARWLDSQLDQQRLRPARSDGCAKCCRGSGPTLKRSWAWST